MKTINVKVNRRHIEMGNATTRGCPIYLALREQYPELHVTVVRHTFAEFRPAKGEMFFGRFPKVVTQWIFNHDYFKRKELDIPSTAPRPIRFTIEVPDGK